MPEDTNSPFDDDESPTPGEDAAHEDSETSGDPQLAGETDVPESDPQAKKKWPWFVGGGALAAVLVALLVAWGTGMFAPAEEEPEAFEPRSSFAPRESQTPSPSPSEEIEVEVDVAIDSVGHMPYSPTWDPPDQGDGWWQIVDPEYGYPENGGTDYVLAHACPSGACAGDAIRELEPGDTFTYLGQPYVVDSKLEIEKTEIADQDIWEHIPGRLVVITCIIDPATGESWQNDIIIASPADQGGLS